MAHPIHGPRAALAALRQAQADQWAAETAQLERLVEFVGHYRTLSADADAPVVAGTEQLIDYGADGTPRLAEFCALEVAAALGMREEAAHTLIGDALELEYRHPQLWRLVRQCRVRVWVARKLVSITSVLPLAEAQSIDAELAEVTEGMSPGRLLKLAEALVLAAREPVECADERTFALSRRSVWFGQSGNGVTEMAGRLADADALFLNAQLDRIADVLAAGGDGDAVQIRRAKALGVLASPARALQLLQASPLDELPEIADTECPAAGQRGHVCGTITVDPDKLLPKSQLVIHLTDATLRTEDGLGRVEKIGPVLAGWVKDLTANTRVQVRPVLKVDALQPADAYEVPAAMREAITLRNPVSVFPAATRTSAGLDIDHTVPYQHGALAQTHPANLGPLGRKQHRAKTHGGWRVSQPWPGSFIWTSPLGYGYLVTPSHSWLIHQPATSELVAVAS